MQAGEREKDFQIKSVKFQRLSPKSCFVRIIKERNALHEHTGQRVHVAQQREAGLKVQLRNAENCCISRTESYEESSEQGHHALETSQDLAASFGKACRQQTVLRIMDKKKPKTTRQTSGPSGRATTCEKKLSASVSASRKVKDCTSFLTAKRSIRANISYNCSFENELFLGKDTRKIQESATFEFEPWPQALRFGSWKISFCGAVMSGSSRPKLVGDWLAEFDCAPIMDDLDHSGFTFDSHQMEFETLDSEVVEGIAKIIPAGRDAICRKSDDSHGQADYVAVLLTLRYQQNTRTGSGINGFAQHWIVQRQPQAVQRSLGRNVVVPGQRS